MTDVPTLDVADCKNCGKRIVKKMLPWMYAEAWYHTNVVQWPERDYVEHLMICPHPYHPIVAEPDR